MTSNVMTMTRQDVRYEIVNIVEDAPNPPLSVVLAGSLGGSQIESRLFDCYLNNIYEAWAFSATDQFVQKYEDGITPTLAHSPIHDIQCLRLYMVSSPFRQVLSEMKYQISYIFNLRARSFFCSQHPDGKNWSIL